MKDEIDEIEKLDEPNLFIVFNMTDSPNKSKIIRIFPKDKESAIEVLRKNGIKEAYLLSTRNPFSEEIDAWNPGELMSPIGFNDVTILLYGPFKRKELLAPMDVVSESDDELDRYMRIARKIEGVVSVERIGNEVVVGIS